MLSFLETFQNNLNYTSTLNIQEVIKFYNLGNKTLKETLDRNSQFDCLTQSPSKAVLDLEKE